MAHEPIFTGEAARILHVGEDTARLYGDTGILAITRTPSGVRIFDRAEVEKLAAQRAQRTERRAR